ncbi:hypothetical protein CHS0354_029938 [Potamilus streckersoni]|uniref:DnaJ homolog subfamily C member 2 n=1 Tax=Potamilus streckersoni TaxID=2493646 RepID=A0AAE0RT97_9BIVA|nr:hypothetical protein CHS0354_029938 [Potamilus streckersoni]
MSAVVFLPPAPEEFTTCITGKISAPMKVEFEPVGRFFEALCMRLHHKNTLSQGSVSSSSSSESEEEDDDEEENESLLLSLDPKDWKNQDHYEVLGLSKLRYKATEDQIKRAYKKKVLKHHPDKRRARGLQVKDGEDDYFTCITRAYEILGNPLKRRAYDSADPLFDDSVPPVNAQSKENFLSVFGPVFAQNSRWSVRRKVPQLGDENSSYDEVNHFYSFWYEFDSWREFSYFDEEEKEKGENRDERKWIEKQNKVARQKRKKEEMARIRQLVDNAYACDPRIRRFKEEEKEKKLAQKRAKEEVIRQKAEEEEKRRREVEEEERKKREEEEEKARAQAAQEKKEKEAQKKALRKERKILRSTIKDFNYFAKDESEKVANMAEVDKLSELLGLVKLQTLNESLTSGDLEKAKEAFFREVQELKAQNEEEKRKQLAAMQSKSGGDSSGKGGKEWCEAEIRTLIKAVNVFPAGTKERWEVIANFIKQHVADSDKNAKDVLSKAKELQKNDLSLKEEAQKKAFEKFEKEHIKISQAKPKEGVTSERYESVAEQQVREMGTNPAPWTADEQKLLEQALKTYPASLPDRWDQISSCIPSRSKKDCMLRYKELVELVRAKKAATEAVNKGKK